MSTVNVFCPTQKHTLTFEQQPLIPYGFKAFGRVPWTRSQVDNYNRYTLEINRATYLPERETLLDRRHAYFVDTTYFNQNYAEAS